MGALTDSEISTVNAVSTVVSVLSLLGSLFILCAYVMFKRLRTFTFSLVAMLSLTDMGNQIFDMLQPPSQDIYRMQRGEMEVTDLCYAQAVGDTFFELASVLWTTAIAYTLYTVVIRKVKVAESAVTMFKYAVVCYGIPTIATIAPAIDNAYGPAGGWCWYVTSVGV